MAQNTDTSDDDAFGHWLAGFIDGEGCFVIWVPTGKKRSVKCCFKISLREDDDAILRDVCKRTDIGSVYARPSNGATNPASSWVITTKADCLGLVQILDRYPLRAKKARDYAVWRSAVHIWMKVRAYGPPEYGRTPNESHWQAMIDHIQILNAQRAYTPRGEEISAMRPPDVVQPRQMTLIG